MRFSDHQQNKNLISINHLAQEIGLDSKDLNMLAKADKIPVVRVDNKFYCSKELLDKGLATLSKEDISLLNIQTKNYVYKTSFGRVNLENILENTNTKSINHLDDAFDDQEEKIINEWHRSIGEKLGELREGLTDKNEKIKFFYIRKLRYYIKLQLLGAAAFFSNKFEQAKAETLASLAPRPYASRIVVITILSMITAIVIVRFSPQMTNKIVKLNDLMFYSQVNILEKAISTYMYNELPAITKVIKKPSQKELSDFIIRNSLKYKDSSRFGEESYLISKEELYGQVAGAEERINN